jgi:peptidoglycan/xylan/chitin deacetylase (PgdA/CDA1 family)
MLNILLYTNTQDSIRYASTEILNMIGLSYTKIRSFKDIKDNERNIIIVPETSKIDLKKIKNSNNYFLIFGDTENALGDYFRLQYVEKYTELEEESPAVLITNKYLPIPIESDFPIYATTKDKILFYINKTTKNYPGILRAHPSVMLIAPQLFTQVATLLSDSAPDTLMQYDLTPRLVNYTSSKPVKSDNERNPIIGSIMNLLLDLITIIFQEEKIPLVQKWYYPNNHKFALCLTHDIDDFFVGPITQFQFALHYLKKKQILDGFLSTVIGLLMLIPWGISRLGIIQNKNYSHFIPKFLQNHSSLTFHNEIMDYISLEKKYGGVSTFFILSNPTFHDGNVNLYNPLFLNLLSCIERAGCEIALHGSYHTPKNGDNMHEEKKLLELLSKNPINGIRQHMLRLFLPLTWELQNNEGFLYDSSLGFRNDTGFPNGISHPFRPYSRSQKKPLSILEIPVTVMDVAINTELQIGNPRILNKIEEVIENTKNVYGVATLLWHPRYPTELYPKWKQTYENILRDYSKSAWLINCTSLAQWWKSRNQISMTKMNLTASSFTFEVSTDIKLEAFTIAVIFDRLVEKVIIDGISCDFIVDNNGDVCIIFDVIKDHNVSLFFE